jgi:hypothetical protein
VPETRGVVIEIVDDGSGLTESIRGGAIGTISPHAIQVWLSK